MGVNAGTKPSCCLQLAGSFKVLISERPARGPGASEFSGVMVKDVDLLDLPETNRVRTFRSRTWASAHLTRSPGVRVGVMHSQFCQHL